MKKYLILTCFLTSLLFCCSIKKEKVTATNIPKTLGTIITDSIAPPVVTMITTANAPKVIIAAKPTIVPLSYPSGIGVPNFTNYTVVDGLPNNSVSSAVIDRQGNIWFATFSGLSKFDGTGFTNYNSDNGLISDLTQQLFIDSKNNIWISTLYGLNIFDGKFFNSIVLDKDILPERVFVHDIMEDKYGSIWLGTQEGLYKYENKIFTKYTTADGLSHKWVRSVLQDKNGNLLITTDGGINKYDPSASLRTGGKSFTPYTDIPVTIDGKSPSLLYCENNGDIWFEYRLGELGRYDGKQIKMYNQKDGYSNGYQYRHISRNSFLKDKAGNYWIGGDEGLTRFDGARFINYIVKDGLSSNSILFITEDDEGNIWAGSQENGIVKINNSYLTTLETPNDRTGVITIDKFGNKWSSGVKGLGKYNSDHIAYYGKELLKGYYPSTLIDHAGNIWFHFYDYKTATSSLVKFNGTEYTIYGKNQGVSFIRVQYMMEDDSNNIWIAGNGGVTKFDARLNDGVGQGISLPAGQASFTHFGNSQGLKSEEGFYSILQDSKNNFWFGSGDAGVFKYDGMRITNYTSSDGLPNNFINDIAEDPLGNIWLATDGGAAKFDGNTFTNYRTNNGLDNLISDVAYDSVNNVLWFATSIGLASLKLNQITDETPFFQHYNPRTGFNFSFIIPRSLSTDKQGIVWSSDFNSTYRFDPKIIKDFKPIPLRIKNISLESKNVSWNTMLKRAYPVDTKDSLTAINEMVLKFGKAFSDEDFHEMSDAYGQVHFDSVVGADFIPSHLVLPFKNNNISFALSSSSISFGKAMQYQYKLDGYDKNWSELSTKTEASFGNMSEGNYMFHVKALSPFGSWSELNYTFKVLPPWWRSWWAYASYIFILGMATFTITRWRTKSLLKEKLILEEKISTRTSELNQSLENLKSTQSQLIQAEKMASLGELTAGIAHEIQNPLNFVNNFSEVNTELIDELNVEVEKGNMDEVKAIAKDIKENEQKINHHGKRAESIVKGMLEHSRKSTGVKEPTDINKLCDEFVRLSYHGLRAKNKDFNCDYKLDLDPNLPLINVVSQDIGRVLLNIINNAFQATDNLAGFNREKINENLRGLSESQEAHKPIVSLTTKFSASLRRCEICISDSGPGIPAHIKDKIFQPFFTTKPTGQGTGLGLSLAYDIVKAHGGSIDVKTNYSSQSDPPGGDGIKVKTKENEGLSAEALPAGQAGSAQAGTEFIIQLPVT